VNYEGAWRPAFDALLSSLQWDVIIYDECHRLKSPSATVSSWAARMRRLAHGRWSLSGTPLAHSPLDAYGVFRALDPGIFGTSFSAFRARYAVMGGFQNRQVLRYQNIDDFRRRFRSVTLSQDSDVLSLPPEQDIEIPITLSSRVLAAYRHLRDEFVMELQGGEQMSAPNALTRMLRLQQITSGFVQETGGETFEILHAEKRDALAEFLSDLAEDEPVVVFCRFRHDLESIHAAAKTARRRSMELSGSRRELERWQEDPGGGAVLAVQIQSGSEGIDLTRAAYGVFFSLGFSLAQYVQARARLVRPTGDASRAPRPVSFYHLIATGTIDRIVYRALASRRDVIETIIHELPMRSEDEGEGFDEQEEQ
jgi:SNF2 family DNA or RNA helicase